MIMINDGVGIAFPFYSGPERLLLPHHLNKGVLSALVVLCFRIEDKAKRG
jgi:hypothetical protein